MKKTFSNYYVLDAQNAIQLWDGCVFILDTSVLLNLYRYPAQVRNEALNILKTIRERLWIPHQVGIEYQENRLSVIAEQVGRYRSVEKMISETEQKIQADLANLQLKKRHSHIDPDQLTSSVRGSFDKYRETLNMQRAQQPDVFDHDEIRDEIDKLFEGKVGEPFSQKDLDSLYKEGDARFAQKRPPGYMDDKKGKDERPHHLWGDSIIQRKYGDLILWKQILREATRRPFRYAIFITDDDKEDWWWIVNSQGDKTIGPRPELVQEALSEGKMALFYMYNTERFLKYSQNYLGTTIKKEVIEQVKDVAEQSGFNIGHYDVMQCISDWLRKTYHQAGLEISGSEDSSYADFVIHTRDLGRIGIQVKDWHSGSPGTFSGLSHLISIGAYAISERIYSSARIVIVALKQDFHSILSMIQREEPVLPESISIVIGSLEYDEGELAFIVAQDLRGTTGHPGK